MLTEQTTIDKLEVLADGTVQVREANQVLKDETVIAQTYHRYVISITDANPDLSRLDEASLAIVEAARTPERLAAGAQRLQEMENQLAG